MKVLVIGGGGREHALVWKLAQSPGVSRIFCAPGNAGTETVAENVAIAVQDLPALVRFAKQNEIALTVVGPDDPLAAGIGDLFESEKLSVFGPRKAAAQLEASKIFAKDLMARAQIPTAPARTFESFTDAARYCEKAVLPLVIKADGLALGKGVVIAETPEQAHQALQAMMQEAVFGAAGQRVVIEQCLRGSECSIHALVSGRDFRLLGSARDHKRAFDGDRGSNTGGMGALSPADNWNETLEEELKARVLHPLLAELKKQRIEFRGLLFPGLMITQCGIQILEFNCRFGDPETQAILPRLRSDLCALLSAAVEGRLDQVPLELDSRVAVTVILASDGYPGKYETGKTITGLERVAQMPDVFVFHAGTKRVGDEIVSAGGRVLAVTALGFTREEARAQAYSAIAELHFEGCRYRRDIALTPARA